MSIRILIVDDDKQLAHQLQQFLSLNGYTCFTAESGERALELLEQHDRFSLVLLDIELPGLSGLNVCKHIRAQSPHLPIIILSVREKEEEKVEAFDVGADDYVTKPFGLVELQARIKVALRHARIDEVPVTKVTVVGPFTIEPLQQQAKLHGKDLDLTPIEYKLLEVLCMNKGRILTYKMLLYKIWGNNYSNEKHYLHVYIYNLRKKVEADPMHPRFIKTEHGIGYRLIVEDNE